MEYTHLSETVSIKTISEDAGFGVFEIQGLFAGYGLTVGNALRRALLSSLPGAAITSFKLRGASHEFTTIPGMMEDLVEFSLSLKRVRFSMHTDEPIVLMLKAKGEMEVVAGDIEANSSIEIMNPDEVLAHLTAKDAVLDLEITVERGLGYSPIESRKTEGRLPIGMIAIDALFTPVTKVNYVVENMRVGDRTDYNGLRLEITTDKTISPSSALHKAANILKDHFDKIATVAVQTFETEKPKAKSKKTVKAAKE